MALGDLVTDFDPTHGEEAQSCPLTDDRWFDRPQPNVEAAVDDDDFDGEEESEAGDVEFGGSEADDFADFDEEDFDDDFDDDFEEEVEGEYELEGEEFPGDALADNGGDLEKAFDVDDDDEEPGLPEPTDEYRLRLRAVGGPVARQSQGNWDPSANVGIE